MRHRVLALVATGLLLPMVAVAQTTTRFTLAWTDDSYRYEGDRRVLVGPQTATLTVITTRGDSVMATLPTGNPDIIDTFDGTMSASRLVLRSRAREAAIRREGDDASAPPRTIAFTVRFEIELQGDSGSGARTMDIAMPPGMSVPPKRVNVSVRREP